MTRKRILIVGAGLAGLLAANLLRRHDVEVIERQPSLPNNHSALLRFRSSIVGDALGIPFKKVRVRKYVLPWSNPLADAMAYSRKVTGVSSLDRSILSATGEEQERFIAPSNLIELMAEGLSVEYGVNYKGEAPDAVISTIPLPAMLDLLNIPGSDLFKSLSGNNLMIQQRDLDAYATIYVPNPGCNFSRISITGDTIIAEGGGKGSVYELTESDTHAVIKVLRLPFGAIVQRKLKAQLYSKILPIEDVARRNLIYELTDKHRIFSLGRFATWRPGLLLDSLVQDIRLIERWISDPYTMNINRARSGIGGCHAS